MNYGRSIRICRAARGLSQKALAVRAGVSAGYLSLLEAGKRNPTADVLEKISIALKIPLHLLVLLSAEKVDIKDGNAQVTHEIALSLLGVLTEAESETSL